MKRSGQHNNYWEIYCLADAAMTSIRQQLSLNTSQKPNETNLKNYSSGKEANQQLSGAVCPVKIKAFGSGSDPTAGEVKRFPHRHMLHNIHRQALL